MNRLGELERRVMDVLWDSPEPTLAGRDIAGRLPDRAYTTVMTIVERLRRKGMIRRSGSGRALRFAAADSREAYRAELMLEAMGSTGDRGAVLVRFAESVSSDEARLLRKALEGVDAESNESKEAPR